MDITPDIKKRLEMLRDKYAAIGQDLNSYLDGLIYANPIVYWDYIEVDALLSLQKPKTDFPDEKIFIVYHQITELYFSLIEHEIHQICQELEASPRVFCHRDLHSRNVMVKDGEQYLIDFQDARMGPVFYDLVSLLEDCYFSLGPKLRESLYQYFMSKVEGVFEIKDNIK